MAPCWCRCAKRRWSINSPTSVDLVLERAGREAPQVYAVITVLDRPETPVPIELREKIQQLKLDREQRLLDQSQANKELIRNLAMKSRTRGLVPPP